MAHPEHRQAVKKQLEVELESLKTKIGEEKVEAIRNGIKALESGMGSMNAAEKPMDRKTLREYQEESKLRGRMFQEQRRERERAAANLELENRTQHGGVVLAEKEKGALFSKMYHQEDKLKREAAAQARMAWLVEKMDIARKSATERLEQRMGHSMPNPPYYTKRLFSPGSYYTKRLYSTEPTPKGGSIFDTEDFKNFKASRKSAVDTEGFENFKASRKSALKFQVPRMKASPTHRFIATGLGASMWFFVSSNLREITFYRYLSNMLYS